MIMLPRDLSCWRNWKALRTRSGPVRVVVASAAGSAGTGPGQFSPSKGPQSVAATGQIGALDLLTGILTWVNAGHMAPMLVRNGTYAGEHPVLLQQILKDEWGFDEGPDYVAAFLAGTLVERETADA